MHTRFPFYFFVLTICSLIAHIPGNTEEPQYQFFGRHMIAQYYDCDMDALNNIQKLKEVMKIATQASGAQILQSVEHSFDPAGFTMVLLLSESHASIHTYPEHRSCFIDFFTCGHHCSAEKFEAILRNWLSPQKMVIEVKERQ